MSEGVDYNICESLSWKQYVNEHYSAAPNTLTRMGLKETAWGQYELANPSKTVQERSMLALPEIATLYMLAKDYYSGEGEIIDLGPLLGVGTNALARGLVDNRKALLKEKRIHSFDLFLAKGMGSVITESSRSGSVFDRFLRNNSDYLDYISITPGDLLNVTWDRAPVEILFVDIAKSWALNTQVIRQFFPYMIPGKTVVVQQDYVHFAEYWIPLTMERFADYFEHLYFVFGSTSVYRLKKEIPNHLLYEDLQELPLEVKLEYLKQATSKAPVSVREILKCSRAYCLIEHGQYDDAYELLKTVEFSVPPSKPYEDFSSLISSNFLTVNLALQKTSGRSIPPNDDGMYAQAGKYKADLRVELAKTEVGSKDNYKGTVWVKNIGQITWSLTPAPVGVVHLGTHLLHADTGEMVDFDFLHYRIGPPSLSALAPDEESVFAIEFPAPIYGRYTLEFDLVCEMICWFEQNGSKKVRIPISVF